MRGARGDARYGGTRGEGLARELFGEELRQRLALLPVLEAIERGSNARGRGDEVAELAPPVGAAVLVHGHVVDVGKREARLAQAVGDRLRWEARPVLEPPEALLLGRCDQHPVAHQRGGGVTVEGVEAEDDHSGRLLSTNRSKEAGKGHIKGRLAAFDGVAALLQFCSAQICHDIVWLAIM
jgi:hypothetical protein